MHIRFLFVPAVLSAASSLSAQATWSALYPPTSPSARSEVLMASHDASQSIVLLFGRSSGQLYSDAWRLQGGTWTQMGGTVPPRRDISAMVYDSVRQRLVMFGGWDGALRDDTWEWNGTTWQVRSAAVRPAARSEHAMAFDPVRGVTVLFGGGGSSGPLQDTWEWDGVTWQQRSPLHAPSARAVPLMEFDPQTRTTLLHGGRDPVAPFAHLSDTWTYDGVDWHQHFVAVPPPARGEGGRMVSDPHRGRVVMLGGTVVDDRCWQWDGVEWRSEYAGAPALRFSQGVAYDAGARRIVLFGGRLTGLSTFALGDTWQFRTAQPADVTAFGDGCTGSAGTPTLANAPLEYPWLGDLVHTVAATVPAGELGALFASSFGSTPPLDLGALGMPGCTLLVSPDVVEFSPAIAGEAIWAVQVPNLPALAGAQFRQQAFVLDAAANALGLVASNAIEATVGIR